MRRLGRQDVEALRSRRPDGLKRDPGAFGAAFEEEVAQPLAQTVARLGKGYVLDGSGALSGAIGLRPGTTRKRWSVATIWGTNAVPEWRGTGLAEDPLQRALAEARAFCRAVRFSLAASKVAARRVQERAGFGIWSVDEGALCIESVFMGAPLLRRDFPRGRRPVGTGLRVLGADQRGTRTALTTWITPFDWFTSAMVTFEALPCSSIR